VAASTTKPRKRKASARRRTCGTGQRRHWAPWVRPISVYSFLNSIDSDTDSAAEPKRPPNPRRGRWA
jgi:hypothetical protein